MARKRNRKRLTDLELEIMHVVWGAHPEPLTVRDVVERMARGKKAPAYTTIQTMLNILRDKQVLVARPGPGRAHVFQARLSREAATDSMTTDFVERLFGGRAEPLLAHLLEHESVDREILETLRRRIEDQLEDEEG